MKVLKKMLAVAVSVATMAMSVSAFAATYDDKTKSVAMTAEELTADGKVPAAITGQMTVVVVPKNLGGASITAGDIYYINQEEFGTKFNEIIMKTVDSDGTVISNGMGLKEALVFEKPVLDENGEPKEDENGKTIMESIEYEVRIGGTNLKNEDGNYTVSFDITVEGGEVTIAYGDINEDEVVDVSDVTMAARAAVEQITLTDAEKTRADVEKDGVVDVSDVTKIARYAVGQITDFGIK